MNVKEALDRWMDDSVIDIEEHHDPYRCLSYDIEYDYWIIAVEG